MHRRDHVWGLAEFTAAPRPHHNPGRTLRSSDLSTTQRYFGAWVSFGRRTPFQIVYCRGSLDVQHIGVA